MSDSILGTEGLAAPASETAAAPAENIAQGGVDWLAGLSEDDRGFAQNKGWKDPADALKSYRSLEVFTGADKAGRGVVLPKDEEDREGYEKLYAALGRPEKAEGYELASLMADEAADPAFMAAMGEVMHQTGLSKAQGQKLALAYQEQYKTAMSAQEERYKTEAGEIMAAMKPADLEAARRVFRLSGATAEEIKALERLAGPKRLVPMFAKIGALLAEDKQVAGAEPSGGLTSPEAAKARMAQLQADPVFSKRYLAGDQTAIDQISALAKMVAAG